MAFSIEINYHILFVKNSLTCRRQQFSLNSFYYNRGGNREALRVQKAMLGGFGL